MFAGGLRQRVGGTNEDGSVEEGEGELEEEENEDGEGDDQEEQQEQEEEEEEEAEQEQEEEEEEREEPGQALLKELHGKHEAQRREAEVIRKKMGGR